MRYETMVKMHKASYLFFMGWPSSFLPKEEYTIFDLLSYIPGYIGQNTMALISWLYDHRKRWVIASVTNEESRKM